MSKQKSLGNVTVNTADDITRGKICCSKCSFLKNTETIVEGCILKINTTVAKCNNENNVRHDVNWYGAYDIYLKSPSEINKNNDCGWFVGTEVLNLLR
jgi:hypothetical protein